MSTIMDRISKLVEDDLSTLTELEREIGAGKGTLTRAKNNNTDIQTKWITKMCEVYPFWSAEWIIRGTGDMYLSDKDSQENVKSLKEKGSAVGDISLAAEPIKTKPHIDDVAAIAGYRGGVAEGVTWHTVIYKPVIVGLPDYDLTMRVSGDSMYPYLCSGDLIALREVRSGYFKPGEIYVVSTDEDAFVKRVFNSDKKGMAIRCESINPAFPPFDLPGESVIRMYRVVGMQRVI